MKIGYELIWLFFVYSFLGWVLETIHGAIVHRRFVNRGLVNSPFCIIYGITAVVIAFAGQELTGFWLFVSSAILATLVEWIAGHMLEKLYHERWWDYSHIKWNLDGYICLPISVLWGLLGVVSMKWGNSLFLQIFHILPRNVESVVIWVLMTGLSLDIVATMFIITGKSRKIEQWESIDSWFSSISVGLEKKLYHWVNGRIQRAYPKTDNQVKTQNKVKSFAAGCSFYKIMLLFFIGSFLGDITETIFCRISAGVWMSRSSVVWGPFSIVWGFAVAAVTVLLYKYRNRTDRFLFIMGTVLGGVYEYLCSVLSEKMFGTVFWDYSKIPFNLGGRINLLYCFFWGIAAVVWFKALYPKLSAWIEKIPEKAGKIVTWILIVFMCCNMTVSFLALVRSSQRSSGIEAEKTWQVIMDQKFSDERLRQIYPNAIRVE